MTMESDRPFATMSDAELRDEIAFARVHATTGTDLVMRRKHGKRLALLLDESGHREWVADGLPW
jgi:hypothetical protein